VIRIKVDRRSKTPLYAQVRDAVLAATAEGRLKPGDRLPTVAAFAKETGVTQSTILRAFEDLTKARRIASHVGRGTFVTDPREAAPEGRGDGRVPIERPAAGPVDPEFALAARRLRMGIASTLESLLALAQRPGLIGFMSGIPAPETVRPDLLRRLALDALDRGQEIYQGYNLPAGMPELRECLAERYRARGLEVTADNILLTNGSQQAVAILAQLALELKLRVICETPCYMGIPRAFGAIGHWVESLPRDFDGPLLERLGRFADGRPSILYLCPEMHNPMGTDLSAERSAALVRWAREQKGVLVADEIFHDLRYDGPSPPSLLGEAGADSAVVIASLSKSFMCGLRTGWLVTSAERVRRIVSLKKAMDIGCPLLMQGIALSLFRSGEYDAHLVEARELYRTRRDAALDALGRHMPEGVRWTRPAGGYHLWVELPQGYSSIALFLLAIERGVAIEPGPALDVDHRFLNAFRLSYGSLEPPAVEEGVRLLADAVGALLRDPPSDSGLTGLGDYL